MGEIDRLVQLATEVLERLQKLLPSGHAFDWSAHRAAVWRRTLGVGALRAHEGVDAIALSDLLHVEAQKASIERNTEQFIHGYPANNVLLWGARGTGKSSLIHALLNRYADQGLRLIEVDKQALAELADIVDQVRDEPYRFVIVCDDLSFEADDASYKQLKSALEGSVFRSSDNVLIYATSNRRHLIAEYMEENLAATHRDGELHDGEAVEEKVSLSDRFGLWISFYPFKQDAYLEVVAHWLNVLGRTHAIDVVPTEDTRREALQWALSRARNGRTAHYFARHWVGRALLERTSASRSGAAKRKSRS